jgi:large conductance mechanosensitive channel
MAGPSVWTEFKQFLLKQNALALAVGVIIGASIGKVVSAIADDVINPLVGLLLPAGDWRRKIVLSQATDATGKITEERGRLRRPHRPDIDFFIVGIVVFLIAKAFIPKASSKIATKSCPECEEIIPIGARRCKACTQPQAA